MTTLGCGVKCMKYALFIFNFVFWVAGATLLSVGIWMSLHEEAFHILKILDASLDDPLWELAVYAMIGVGAVLFLFGFLGCCGACMENRCLLLSYAVLLGIMFVLQVSAGALVVVYRTEIGDVIKEAMTTQVEESYQDETSGRALTRAWNYIQVELECCGGDSYEDYANSDYKTRTNKSVPYTCCHLEDYKEPDAGEVDKCREEASKNTSNPTVLHQKGCYQRIKDWIDSHSWLVMGLVFGVAIIQIFGICMACCVASAFKSAQTANNYV